MKLMTKMSATIEQKRSAWRRFRKRSQSMFAVTDRQTRRLAAQGILNGACGD